MQEKIGFYWQPNYSGSCGQYSLRHSLLLLGIPITIKDAHKATKVNPIIAAIKGTDENKLKKAIYYYDCHPIVVTTKNKIKFREKLDNLLMEGIPAIVSFNEDEHWAVVCGKKSKDTYFIIDSADDDLITSYHWSDLIDYIDNDTYYLIGVKPDNENHLKHSLVQNFSKAEKVLNRGDELFAWWGYYLEDLNEVFDCPNSENNIISAEEFFKYWGEKIFNSAKYFYSDFDQKQMKWELNNYKIVAELHNLTLSKDKLTDAIINFTAAFAFLSVFGQ